jgi:hypothetical protein
MVVNVRYEHDHPLLSTAQWFDSPSRVEGLQHLIAIFSSCSPMDSTDESIVAARSAIPQQVDFEQQCALFPKSGQRVGIAWIIRRLSAKMGYKGAKLTIVGVEDLGDAALGFISPMHCNLPWQERKELLEQRLATIAGLFEQAVREGYMVTDGRPPAAPHFMTRAEYRDLVGEAAWHLETCEPAGPWSDVASCHCRAPIST